MKISISHVDGYFCADFVELPGTPNVGLGRTKEHAIAQLFLLNLDKIENLPRKTIEIDGADLEYVNAVPRPTRIFAFKDIYIPDPKVNWVVKILAKSNTVLSFMRSYFFGGSRYRDDVFWGAKWGPMLQYMSKRYVRLHRKVQEFNGPDFISMDGDRFLTPELKHWKTIQQEEEKKRAEKSGNYYPKKKK